MPAQLHAASPAIISGYGRKGMGWVKNPRKAVYNKICKQTTFSLRNLFK